MKKIILVNGSPKLQLNFSGFLLDKILNKINDRFLIMDIAIQGKSFSQEEKYEIINQGDIVVIAMPFYSEIVPSIVIEFLDGLEDYLKEKGLSKQRKLYCISNLRELQGRSNYNSLEVIRFFAEKTMGINYYGGLGIGGGEYLNDRRKLFLSEKKSDAKKKVDELVKYINNEEQLKDNLYSDVQVNEKLYKLINNINWFKIKF